MAEDRKTYVVGVRKSIQPWAKEGLGEKAGTGVSLGITEVLTKTVCFAWLQ